MQATLIKDSIDTLKKEKYLQLKSEFLIALGNHQETTDEDLFLLGVSDQTPLSQEETINYVDKVFQNWFEQKIFRMVQSDKLDPIDMGKYDLKSVKLHIENQYWVPHTLLNKEGVKFGLENIRFNEDVTAASQRDIEEESKIVMSHYM